MSAITAKASRKMKKYAVLTREPRCFLGSFDFSWEQRKLGDIGETYTGLSGKTKADFGHGQARFVTYMNVFSNPISNPEMTEPIEIDPKQNEVEVGDVFFTTSSETPEEVGMSSVLLEKRGKTYLNSFCFGFRPSEKIDSYYLAYMLRSESAREKIILLAQGISRYNISKNKVMEIAVSLPSLDEQKLIGQYFRQLDNLITLHQRKCALLFSSFQALISMMFTTSTFSWEQRKLEDYLTVSTEKNTGNIYGRSDVLSVSGDYGIVNQIEFQGRSFAGASVLNYGVVQTGDVVYTKSPLNSNPYGIIKTNKGKPGIVSTLYAVYHPKENTFSDFIQVYFEQHARMNNYMHPLVNKGAKNDMKVSSENALKGPVCFPSRVEQESISAFFSVLDNLITLHQRKCISFTGRAGRLISTVNKKRITSSWEQRKFEEIAVRSSVICSDDTLPRVEYEDIVSGTGRLNKDIYAKQSSKSGIAFHQGDVLYGKLRPYLQNWLLPTFDGLAVGDFWVLQPQNADSSFLYRLIQSRQFDEVANQSTGTKMPRADWKLVSKTVFSIPSNISEQAAIGTYFTALDSLITLHQRKPFLMKWRTSDANRNQTNRLVL